MTNLSLTTFLLTKNPAQGPGIGAAGADAGGGGGGEPLPPSKSYDGHPEGPGAQQGLLRSPWGPSKRLN